MNRTSKLLVAVCAVMGLTACRPKPAETCGGEVCSMSQRCDQNSLHCVEDLPPVITMDAPAVVSTATFMVTGTVTDDDQVKTAEWRTGSREWTAIDLQSGGAFTLTVDAPALDAENIVISIRASDTRQDTKLDRDVRVDRVGPTVTLQSPDAGSVLSTATIGVAVVVTDGSGALSELSVNNQTIASPMSGAVVTASVDVPVGANNLPIQVPVSAADSRGNRTMTSFTLYGDRVPPDVTITSPVATDVLTTAMMTVTFTASDPSGVLSATCGDTTGATATATQTGGNGWSCTLPVAVDERPETVSVVVLDAARNATTATVTFAIDRIAPTVTVDSPQPGFIVGQPITVSLTTSVADVAFARFGNGPATQLGGGGTTWTGVVPLPSHDFAAETLIIEVPDDYGNTTTVMVAGFTDTVAPVVNITSPSQGERFNIASFSGGNTNVHIAWSVSDADPMAGSISDFNGTPLTTQYLDRPTDPTDNPYNYAVNVVRVTDRAGNTGTASVSYSVDRVAPTIVSWTPANGARNFVPRETVMTFSEPIQVSNPSYLPVVYSPAGNSVTGFDTARRVWTGGISGFAMSTVTVTPATDIVDDYGNPAANLPAARRFYVGTDRAPGTLENLGGPAEFDASSDSDGVLSVATSAGGQLNYFHDDGFSMQRTSTGITRNDILSLSLNSANVVSPSTLASSSRVGVVVYGTSTWTRWVSIDGVATTDVGSNPQVAAVTQPPMSFEGTSATGTITGSTFTRSPKTWPLLNSTGGSLRILQSNSGWIIINPLGSSLEWERFYCGTGPFGQFCGSTLYRSNTSGVERGSAITRGGSCAAFVWGSSVVFQTKPACESNSVCANNLSVASVGRTNDERFAPWDVPGEDTLLVAYRSGELVGVNKLATSTCNMNSAVQVVPPTRLPGVANGSGGPNDFLPVRVGNRTGVVYRTNAGISLYVF